MEPRCHGARQPARRVNRRRGPDQHEHSRFRRPWSVRPEDVVDGAGRIALHVHADVAVGVERETGGRVAEARADDLGGDTGPQHQRRCGVAQIVEAHGAECGGRDQAVERLRDPIGRLEHAIVGGKDEVLILVGGSEREPVFDLAGAVCTERVQRLVREGNRPAPTGGFGWTDRHAGVRQVLSGPGDRGGSAIQVEVLPPEPEQLAQTQARGHRRVDHAAKVRVRAGIKEEAHLLWLQRPHLSVLRPRRSDHVRGVPREDLPAQRLLEGPAEDTVMV